MKIWKPSFNLFFMSDTSETFFTSVGCMDGRVQEPVTQFGRAKFGAQFADTITEAGLVGKLAHLRQDFGGQASDSTDQNFIDSLRFKIADVSVGKHRSRGAIVHGHQDCAGNPVSDEIHKEQVKKAADFVRSLVPEIEVVPVFVVRQNGVWKVMELE